MLPCFILTPVNIFWDCSIPWDLNSWRRVWCYPSHIMLATGPGSLSSFTQISLWRCHYCWQKVSSTRMLLWSLWRKFNTLTFNLEETLLCLSVRNSCQCSSVLDLWRVVCIDFSANVHFLVELTLSCDVQCHSADHVTCNALVTTCLLGCSHQTEPRPDPHPVPTFPRLLSWHRLSPHRRLSLTSEETRDHSGHCTMET